MLSEPVERALAERDIQTSERGWRSEVARRIARYLEQTPIQHPESIDRAATIDEIAVAVLGVGDDSARQLASQESSLGGRVQYECLSNGHVLCKARVDRKVTLEDGSVVTHRYPARFVSSNAELVSEYCLKPHANGVKGGIGRTAKLFDHVGQRIPALVGAKAEVGRELIGLAQAQLTS